jgi:nucleoside-diphosphate-sugar epimerase
MRILVTGAAGAVGSAVVPAVAAQGHSVTAVDRIDFTSSDADPVLVGDLVDKEVATCLPHPDGSADRTGTTEPRGADY